MLDYRHNLPLFKSFVNKPKNFRQFANGSKMDKTEIETYKLFLPEMEKFEIEKIGHTAMRYFSLNENVDFWIKF